MRPVMHPVLRGMLAAAAAVLVTVLVSLLILLARGPDRQGHELGASFRYDISALRRVDPALVIADEQAGFAVGIEQPAALAMGPTNRIFVGGSRQIAWFDADGRRAGGFPVPAPVTALCADDPQGRILAAFRDRVVLFSYAGDRVGGWAGPGSNAVFTALVVLEGDVFVADAGSRLVLRYGMDGRVKSALGGKDSEYREGFVIPSPYFPLQKASDDTLWVVDPGRHRFVNFTSGGRVRSSWEKGSMTVEGFCGCCNPTHFAVREDGSFVTSEKGIERVKIHAPDGSLVGVVAPPELFRPDTRGLALAVDEAGRILVLDPEQARVRVFLVREKG